MIAHSADDEETTLPRDKKNNCFQFETSPLVSHLLVWCIFWLPLLFFWLAILVASSVCIFWLHLLVASHHRFFVCFNLTIGIFHQDPSSGSFILH